MMSRAWIFWMMIVIVAACASETAVTPTDAPTERATEAVSTAAPEATEALDDRSEYDFELTEEYVLDMNWGGQAAFNYPEGWRVVLSGSDLTIYGVDNYNISISVNNDPNDNRTPENILNTMNQSFDIERVERDGQTLLYTPIRAGNGLGGATWVDEDNDVFAVTQMVNTRGRDLDPMLETMLEILASTRVVEAAEQ